MPTFTVKLKNFDFPEELDNKKANFRFIFDVRYVAEDGNFATEHAVMPSLDTFWECDKRKSGNPNFVRKDDDVPQFDMSKIDDWDRLAIRLTGQRIDSVQVKVIDVDRKDVFDKLTHVLGSVLESAMGTLKTRGASRIPQSRDGEGLPLGVRQSLGSAADDVEALVLKKLAGGDDVLFRGSSQPDDESLSIVGRGTSGHYTIVFSVDEEPT